MKTEELLSKKNMRLLNVLTMVLIIVAWLVRFYYFFPREVIVEEEISMDEAGSASETTQVEVPVKTEVAPVESNTNAAAPAGSSDPAVAGAARLL